MLEQIMQNIDDPEGLEVLFRKNKTDFIRDFSQAASGKDTDLVKFWKLRIESSEQVRPQPETKSGWAVVTFISVIAALMVKLPLAGQEINPEDFYARNLVIIVFSGLVTWFIAKNRITGWKNILILAVPITGLVLFMNLLPETMNDTTQLAFIHAPLFMAFIFGLAFVSLDFRSAAKISGFIRYCGELVIMTGLLAIAGAILSGMTIGLFEVIGMDIGEFYMVNIGIVGVAVFPVVAAWLIDLYPDITRRITPILARVFTPLVLIMAVVYLIAMTVSGVDLSKNRELLIIFNLLLLGVLVIILFSLSELDKSNLRNLNVILLFLLAVATLVIDIFALSAILTRLSEGFTPNRTVVLASNILVLINLILIIPDLFLAGFKGKSPDRVERIVSRYLPVYFLYSIVVIFVFPFVFGMK